MVLCTDHITSSHMHFRGLKPDMHAIVILNHRLGRLEPRSTESQTQGELRMGEGTETVWAMGQRVHDNPTSIGV